MKSGGSSAYHAKDMFLAMADDYRVILVKLAEGGSGLKEKIECFQGTK